MIGDGDQKEYLEKLVKEFEITDNVIFTGKLDHDKLINYLSESKAMLIYTEKDNSMISIAESIAVCTPVITTSVPDNAKVIDENMLGIVSDNWNWETMKMIVNYNNVYVSNCKRYRENLDDKYNVKLFIDEARCLHG